MKSKIVISSAVVSIVGVFVIEIAQGMPEDLPNQKTVTNSTNNKACLPAVKRRFSEGMINPVSWRKTKKNKRKKNNKDSSNQQQHEQIVPEKNLITNQFAENHDGEKTSSKVEQQIDGNFNQNTIFFPTLRNPNINQEHKIYEFEDKRNQTNIHFNATQHDRPQSYQQSINNNVLNSNFSLSEVLWFSEQQSLINVEKVKIEMYERITKLERQNEALKREIQNYRSQKGYFFQNKIANLEDQIIQMREYIKNLNEKHEEVTNALKEQQRKNVLNPYQVFVLAQQNEELKQEIQHYKDEKNRNFPQELILLEKQTKELKCQIAEEKINHEKEIQELNNQLKEEKDLNLLFNLNSESIWRSKI